MSNIQLPPGVQGGAVMMTLQRKHIPDDWIHGTGFLVQGPNGFEIISTGGTSTVADLASRMFERESAAFECDDNEMALRHLAQQCIKKAKLFKDEMIMFAQEEQANAQKTQTEG